MKCLDICNEYAKLVLVALLYLSSVSRTVRFEDIIKYTRVINREKLEEFILKLEQCNVVTTTNNAIKINNLAELALIAIVNGADPEYVSRYISWRDFELLITKELRELGFEAYKSIRLKGPRALEVDILAIDVISNLCLVIDCKHWLPGYSKVKKLMLAAHKHIERMVKLNNACEWLIPRYGLIRKCKYFIPVIITLTDPRVRVLSACAIIPVALLRSFIFDIHKFIEELNILRLENRCYVSL